MVGRKWTEGINPRQPVSRVARRLLRDRFDRVWYHAKFAAAKGADRHNANVESVHQLRVATRRAEATLLMFSDLLRRKDASYLRKQLRAFRKAAGRVRDLDVLLERMQRNAKAQTRTKSLRGAIGKIAQRRAQAQRPLRDAYRKAKRAKFRRRCRKALQHLRWRESTIEPTFQASAQQRIEPIANRFFDVAKQEHEDIESLHQMRISAKRLRYALEALSTAFARKPQRVLYAALEEIQEDVGVVNDHANAITMLRRRRAKNDKRERDGSLDAFLTTEQAGFEKKLKDFCDRWNAVRIAQLEHTLANATRVPKHNVAEPRA